MKAPRTAAAAALTVLLTAFAAAPANLAQDILFERLSLSTGLTQTSIHDLFQDRDGFLWIGSRTGIGRYDGYTFRFFRHDEGDPGSLSHNVVNVFHEDGLGRLWIGTGSGLNLFDRRRERFTVYLPDEDSKGPANIINRILGDGAGGLWLGTWDGLFHFDPETGGFQPFRHDPDDPGSLAESHVEALAHGPSGQIWIGTSGEGVDAFDPKDGTFQHHRPDPEDPKALASGSITALYQDSGGRLWIGTHDGLHWRDGEGAFHRLAGPTAAATSQVSDILEDPSGALWVGLHTGGLVLVDRETLAAVQLQHRRYDPRSLSSDTVQSLLVDRSGVLWVGTRGGGLNKGIRRGFVRYLLAGHPAGNDVTAVHADNLGRVWIGTQQAGLTELDRRTGAVRTYRHEEARPESLTDDYVAAILLDRRGTLWVATLGGGLDRLESPSGGFVHYRPREGDPSSLPSPYVHSLFEDRAGTLWVGTYGEGVSRYRPGTDDFKTYAYRGKNEAIAKRANIILTLGEEAAGGLWLGTRNGLARFSPEASGDAAFRYYRHDPGDPKSLSDDFVNAILDGGDSHLWLGTHGGLDRFDVTAGSVDRLGERHERLSGVVHGVLGGEDGRLWVAVLGGLLRFDPATEEIRAFDVHDGLQGEAFNIGASYRSPTGELFFGGTNGLNAFRPGDIAMNRRPPQVVVTSFKVFDHERDLSPGDAIVLKPQENYFSFEYAALDFTDPEHNRYAYRLEGVDREWVDAGSRRFASYTNLDPGSYVFRVKASNSDGVWNEEGVAVDLEVLPPYYKLWWFRLGMVLALALLLWGGHHYRLHELRQSHQSLEDLNATLREENERRLGVESENRKMIAELIAQKAESERLARTFAHDLRNPLVTIRSYLGVLKKDIDDEDTDKISHDVEVIDEATATMAEMLHALLELSEIGRGLGTVEDVSMAEVAGQAVSELARSLVRRGVSVAVGNGLPTVRGERRRLRELLVVLLDNAIEHMGEVSGPYVEIDARRDGDDDVCFVRDNGVGIEPRYQERVFGVFEQLDPKEGGSGIGLPKAKRIVELHGGRIWIESEGGGRGCTVCFTLKGPMEG